MAERDFDAARKKKKGHKFTLAGREFRTHPSMSLTFLRGDETDEAALPLTRTLNFIRAMLVKEDRKKWDAMLSDSEVYIEADDILDVSNWIIEVISGRPTKAPVSSGNGDGGTSSPSKARSSATAASGSKTSRQKKPSPSAT